MKHIIALFCLALALTSCEGDQGIPGVDGVDGEVAPAFEIELDFNAANNYEITQTYGFTIVPSDVVLVYMSWETVDGTEIWRLVPQTQFFDDGGVLTYNYDFTDTDFRIFLDATFDLGVLDDVWTQNQFFRVVVVPADYINGLDIENYDDIIQATDIDNFETL
ncbi:hypothetical protein [Formosa algae]|uniref:Dihydrolipoamide dehydrogenase n=1 Tax=Formosa algae TaxID=225843 RepID=A0A9X0YNH2_9FLAO|nr:hypothetical protein [Formosa algae]MBP1840462.1 hypothetical protein [Formosa algae]MDQ0336954.1 hypothetical protein [Formosa algae]OEI80839.1 hypothetical protein AST99_07255 [Formosa algae]PNW28172.1 hypothetical protein BKP44_09880 [Formosa algae]